MSVTLPADDFTRGAHSVLPAASTDGTVPAIACVRVEWDADGFTFVATDRYVCAEQTIPLPDGERGAGGVSIPVATVKSALAVLKATGVAGVDIVPAGAWEKGSVAGIEFEAPGEFPKYRSLFPATGQFGPIEATVLDPALLAKLAGPKRRGRHSPLRFAFTPPAQGSNHPRPIVVTRTEDEHFRGLLMPIKPTV